MNQPRTCAEMETMSLGGDLDEFFDFAQLEADNEASYNSVSQHKCDDTRDFPAENHHVVTGRDHPMFERQSALVALPSQSHSSTDEYMINDPDWTDTTFLPDQHQELQCDLDMTDDFVTAVGADAVPTDILSMVGTNPTDFDVTSTSIPALSVHHMATDRPESNVRSRPPTSPSRQPATSSRTPASAKRKGPQSRIPLEAKQVLEDEFATNPYPCSWEIDIIAHQANLDAKRVRNWFNNSRARKKPDANGHPPDITNECNRSLATKLSAESLEALSKCTDDSVAAVQPPLQVYLSASYQEEAVTLSAIQAAIEHEPPSQRGDTVDTCSRSRMGKSASVITSQTSSDGTAPTAYTVSSRGSSSFGRDRRRGRRRMTWRNTPYARTKIHGLDSSGVPTKGLPFFCTFCPRAFKTKYEWTRHENSVHALRTTWICCNTKSGPLDYCPFCGQKQPDDFHMQITHKYQQCRNKPETQRTFYRRDHFIQHLHHVHFSNIKHPSPWLGCQARLTAAGEGQEYGCKDLAMRWRKFGAPMRSDDPMLHCGFCGMKLKDWNTRCDHVADHLLAGGFDRSAWWPGRLENHMENLIFPQTGGPFRCRYCQKVFSNPEARDNHTHCRVWSCRFLRTSDDVASENSGPPLCPQFPSPKAHHCHLCGAGYKSDHVEHALQYHKYRSCKQKLYTCQENFLEHLHEYHGASQPFLLQYNTVIEQHFSRNKGASFEPLGFDEILQGCREGTLTTTFVDPFTAKEIEESSNTDMNAVPSAAVPVPSKRKTMDRLTQRPHKGPISVTDPGPRFFRLDPLVPFLSSRVYYLRNAKMSNLFHDGKALLEEVPNGHIASLVMSSGLLGMAGVRLPVQMRKDLTKGLVELALDD